MASTGGREKEMLTIWTRTANICSHVREYLRTEVLFPMPSVLSASDLKNLKGIPFTRQHIHRLVRAGKFPRPLKLGEATNGWLEEEIDDWLLARKEERDRAASAEAKCPVAPNKSASSHSAEWIARGHRPPPRRGRA